MLPVGTHNLVARSPAAPLVVRSRVFIYIYIETKKKILNEHRESRLVGPVDSAIFPDSHCNGRLPKSTCCRFIFALGLGRLNGRDYTENWRLAPAFVSRFELPHNYVLQLTNAREESVKRYINAFRIQFRGFRFRRRSKCKCAENLGAMRPIYLAQCVFFRYEVHLSM